MPAVILSLGPLNLTLFGVFFSFGFLLASFIFFQKSHKEFAEEDQAIAFIVNLALGVLVGGRLFFFLSHPKNFPQWQDFFLIWRQGGLSLWGSIIGFILSVYFTSKKMKIDPWRLSDFLILPFFIMIFAFLLPNLIMTPSLANLLLPLSALISLLVSLWLSSHYRSLIWYPSGKIGLASLAGLALFSFFYLLLAFSPFYVLYLWEAIISGIIIVSTLGIAYHRSGRELKKDFSWLIKNKKEKNEKK